MEVDGKKKLDMITLAHTMSISSCCVLFNVREVIRYLQWARYYFGNNICLSYFGYLHFSTSWDVGYIFDMRRFWSNIFCITIPIFKIWTLKYPFILNSEYWWIYNRLKQLLLTSGAQIKIECQSCWGGKLHRLWRII